MKKGLAIAGFLATILGANYLTTRYGLIPVGFGQLATAGTYLAGLAFVLRDAVQDTVGRWWTLTVIGTGAVVSFTVAAPFIAVASALAFLMSETADFLIYTPLRERGYIRAAVASNIVGAVVDTLVFLTVAGFSIREAFAGQMVGKLTVTLLVVLLVWGCRGVLRQSLNRAGR